MSIEQAEVKWVLDGSGSWKVVLPLTDPRTAEAQVGRIWQHYREGEGFVFAGLIETARKVPEGGLELAGPTLLEELLFTNTLINRQYDTTVQAVIDALLTGTGWARSGDDATTITVRFDGESMLRAVAATMEVNGKHFREAVTESAGALTRTLEIGAFGASSGVIITGGTPDTLLLDDAAMAFASGLKVEETGAEVWNWILPLGAGDGTAQLTLRYSTRTTPYTIQNTTGPDGEEVYYIADAASISTYGQRERVFVAKDVAPLSASKAALVAGANALYDLAVTQLQWWKDKQTAYSFEVRGLVETVKPGDKVRLRWRGQAEHWEVKYVYLDVDVELFVLSRQRRFLPDGTAVDRLVVSDIDRQLQTSNEVIIGAIEDTARVFRTKIVRSVSNITAGPMIEALNASYPAQFDLFIDDNVSQLLRCKLRLKPRNIRSTATGAGAGGAHTHTTPAHKHKIVETDNVYTWSDPIYCYPYRMHDLYGSAFSMIIGAGPAHGSTSLYSWADDGGSTSGASVTHAHAQVYGIYESGAATAMTIKIDGTDRTAALGGPWSAAAVLDISTYLLDGDGVVVQGVHPIEIGSSTIGRVEIWTDLVVAVQALVVT